MGLYGILIFCGLALVFIAWERVAPALPGQRFFRHAFFVDAAYGPLNVGARFVMNFALGSLVVDAMREVAPQATDLVIDLPVWMQALVILLVLDAVFYVLHRAKHTVPWMWRLHETHHSSTTMDWLAAVRFHPLEKVLDRAIYVVPLAVLGASEAALLIWSTIDVLFGFLNHSNVRVRGGPLRYVFVLPEMHRLHHADDARYLNVNFGNNLSIFDWVFGTASVGDAWGVRFGTGDPQYPQTSLWRQIAYAFRRG